MSEHLVQAHDQAAVQQVTPEAYETSQRAYFDSLNALGQRIPEVSDRSEELSAAGAEIINTFGVQPEFFADASRMVLFTSIAGNYASLQKNSELSHAQQQKEREFLSNGAFLLTRNFSDNHSDLKQQHETEVQGEGQALTDSEMLAVYDKYTDPELTRELGEKIQRDGLYDEVLDRLGIDPANATPVHHHVLSVGNGDEATLFDVKAHGLEWQEANQWALGLQARGKNLADDLQSPDAELIGRATGFIQVLNGEQHIFFPLKTAEVLLAEERGFELSPGFQHMSNVVIGAVRHEKVHSEKSVLVEDCFGWSVDERRAEFFSGDKGEYYDTKKFFTNLALLKGTHIKDLFEKEAEGRRTGNEVDIYQQLTETYGLDLTIKLAAVMPRGYQDIIKSSFMKDMVNSLGSYSEITADYGRSLSDTDKDAARTRIDIAIKDFEAAGHDVAVFKEMVKPAQEGIGKQ